MNELFAGYANYASTQTVLIESLIAGNSEVSDPQSTLSWPFSSTLFLTISLPFTVTV